jgi:hypothetical protein
MNWLIVLYVIGSLLISIGAGITLREKETRYYYGEEFSFSFFMIAFGVMIILGIIAYKNNFF